MSNKVAGIRKNTARQQATSPGNRQIHCTVDKTQGMTPGSVTPRTPAGQGVGAGVELFAEGVKLLGSFSVAYAVRHSLDTVCQKVDSQRLVANGGVLLALNIELSQIVAEPSMPPPPIVKGAYIIGYPANPYEEVRKQMTGSRLRGRFRNVTLEIYYLWVTPRMYVDRQYAQWPVLAKEQIDLSGPSPLSRLIGPACRKLDQMVADWRKRRAEEAARRKAAQPPRPPSQPSTPVGGTVHTFNQ